MRAFFDVQIIITLSNKKNYDKIYVYNNLDELFNRKDESKWIGEQFTRIKL